MIGSERIGINSVSTGCDDLERTLEAYADAGFRTVEFQLGHVHEFLAAGGVIEDVIECLDRYDLECVGGFETTLTCFGEPSRVVDDNQRVIENAELLDAVGAETMVVGTDGPGDDSPEELQHHVVDRIDTIADAMAHTGVTLCLEFNWSPIIRSLWFAADIVRACSADNVGVLFDPAHYHCTPTKFAELTSENVAAIKHVHVDDMAPIPGELSHCNADRRLPGRGHLDLRALFGEIEEQGYDGSYTIEMFDDRLRAMPVADAARELYESLDVIRTG